MYSKIINIARSMLLVHSEVRTWNWNEQGTETGKQCIDSVNWWFLCLECHNWWFFFIYFYDIYSKLLKLLAAAYFVLVFVWKGGGSYLVCHGITLRSPSTKFVRLQLLNSIFITFSLKSRYIFGCSHFKLIFLLFWLKKRFKLK